MTVSVLTQFLIDDFVTTSSHILNGSGCGMSSVVFANFAKPNQLCMLITVIVLGVFAVFCAPRAILH